MSYRRDFRRTFAKVRRPTPGSRCSQRWQTGRSRLIAYVRATTKEELTVDGFLTFVYVDDQGKSRPHGITIEAETPEEIELQELANQL